MLPINIPETFQKQYSKISKNVSETVFYFVRYYNASYVLFI